MPIKPLHPVPRQNRPPRPQRETSGKRPEVDANTNAVPFKVTAFAAAVSPLPAISDAAEDEPVFDKSRAKRVMGRKRSS